MTNPGMKATGDVTLEMNNIRRQVDLKGKCLSPVTLLITDMEHLCVIVV